MKRAFDLALCLLAVPLVLPLFCLVALAIALDDGGPVLFLQRRVGLGRRPFLIFKFRTMRDGEVTRVGRHLRASGLDETAQWFNVLRGQMSIVGPRPLTAADVHRLGWDHARMDVRFRFKPGITGLAQLYGGVGERWTRTLDRLYRRHAGVWLDTRLVLWSVAVNLVGKRRVRALLFTARRRPSM